MKNSYRNIIIFLTIIAIVIGVVIFLNNRVKQSDVNETDETVIESTEKHSKGKDTKDYVGSLVENEAQKEDKSVSISGETAIDTTYDGNPNFDKVTVVLKTLGKPSTIIQSIICQFPGTFKFENVAKGEYLIDGLPVGDWVTMPDYIKVTGENDIEEILISYIKKTDFEGIVLYPDGSPVEGAKVLISEWPDYYITPVLFKDLDRYDCGRVVETDKEGKFSGFSRIMCVNLIAMKEGYSPEMIHICGINQRSDSPIILRLSEGANITGTVLDSTREPYSGVLVFAYFCGDKDYAAVFDKNPQCWLVETDSLGKFIIKDVPNGNYKILVRDPLSKMGTIIECKAIPKKTVDAGDIILNYVQRIKVTVVDKEGRGVPDVKISFSRPERSYYSEPWISNFSIRSLSWDLRGDDEDEEFEDGDLKIDADGNFIIRYFEEDIYEIRVECEGYRIEKLKIDTAKQKDVTITLSKIDYINLTVKVIDGNTGQFVSDAKVNLFVDKTGDTLNFNYAHGTHESAKTNESGFASFKIADGGKYVLSAMKDNLCSEDIHVGLESGKDEIIELPMYTAPSLIVSVISEGSNTPIEGADVYIKSEFDHKASKYWTRLDKLVFDSYQTDTDGKAFIPNMPEGTYTISAKAFGYAKEKTKIMQKAGENLITLPLETISVVRGTVFSKKGNPVQYANVFAISTHEENAEESNAFDNAEKTSAFEEETELLRTREIMTNAEGKYAIDIPAAGKYHIIANHYEYAYGKSDKIEVGEKEIIENILIILSEGGSISGKVTDKDGNPLQSIIIRYALMSDKQNIFDSVRTEKSGRYRFDHLTPGNYVVIAFNKTFSEFGMAGTFSPAENDSGGTSPFEVVGEDITDPPIISRENVIVVEGIETKNIDFVVKVEKIEESEEGDEE